MYVILRPSPIMMLIWIQHISGPKTMTQEDQRRDARNTEFPSIVEENSPAFDDGHQVWPGPAVAKPEAGLESRAGYVQQMEAQKTLLSLTDWWQFLCANRWFSWNFMEFHHIAMVGDFLNFQLKYVKATNLWFFQLRFRMTKSRCVEIRENYTRKYIERFSKREYELN